MKNYRYQFFLLQFLTGFLLISCSKSFLTKPQIGALDSNLLKSKSGIDGLLIGTYSALRAHQGTDQTFGGGDAFQASPDNWIYGSVAGGDASKGSQPGDQPLISAIQDFVSNASNPFFNSKWIAPFEGIHRANNVLKILKSVKEISLSDRTNIIGQARFLRGHFYFELKKMFNMVPYIDENTIDLNQPNTLDIWSKIEADFLFAFDSLPTIQTDIGRANKWIAGAYLAKAYMFDHKYDLAKAVLDSVILKGQNPLGVPFALNTLFHDNFSASTNNSPESVFAIQTAAGVDAETFSPSHANGGDFLNFPNAGPVSSCCGFYLPSIDLVNHFRTDPITGLPDLDNYNSKPIKTDLGLTSSQPFTPESGTVDPRLDWTVGRRGIPFLDWGIMPGQDWIRDQQFAGPYEGIKQVYTNANQDTEGDQNSFGPGTAVNFNLIRFADVILWAAEAEAQLGDLTKAQTYVNMIRSRAANRAGFVFQYADETDPTAGFTNIPAANYKVKPYPAGAFAKLGQQGALKAIYYERQLELAMEGHRFFDLVRWGIADQAINAYFQYQSTLTTDVVGGSFTKGRNEYFPIPQAQIDLSYKNGKPVLIQNPGYN